MHEVRRNPAVRSMAEWQAGRADLSHFHGLDLSIWTVLSRWTVSVWARRIWSSVNVDLANERRIDLGSFRFRRLA